MKSGNLPSVHAVADYFLSKVPMGNGDGVTNLKLQKLVYYAQAWSVALRDGRPMFSERMEAWASGPVCPPLYRRFKKYRWQLIDPSDLKDGSLKALGEDDINILDEVWKEYGRFSATELSALAHREDPWKIAYGDLPQGSACDQEILLDGMRDFYQKKLGHP